MIRDESGLTIIEMMVAIAVASAICVALLAISVTFFGSTIRSQVRAQMAADSHYTLRSIIEDVRVAEDVAASNSLVDANEPSGGWVTSSANNTLILDRPATDSDIDIIYNTSTGDPYTNELIYFVDNGTLYKRLLKNDAASGNTVTTSCPQAAASSSCPSDRELAPNVSDMSFVFYDSSNVITTDPLQARSVEISLTMERQVFGSKVRLANTIYTKLRN